MEISAETTAMEEKDIKMEETKLELDLEEIKCLLSSASLASVTVGGFLVVMRSNFDLTISGEPYTGLLFLLNLETGKYLSRIWNQTVATGVIVNGAQLMEACDNHFGQGRPCLGWPQEKEEYDCDEFLVSQTPIPRKISPTCLKLLGKDNQDSVSSCLECSKLSYSGMSSPEIYEPQCLLSKNDNATELGPLSCIKTEYLENQVVDDTMQQKNGDDFENGKGIGEQLFSRFQQYSTSPLTHQTGKQGGDFEENETKELICKWCPFTAARQYHLKCHIDEVHKGREVKKFKCEKCPRVAVSKSALEKHIRAVHDNIKDHVCTACGSAFNSKGNLKIHTEQVHAKIKKFSCDQCPYTSQRKHKLKSHMESVHHQSKSFVCPACGSAFSWRHALKAHIEEVHEGNKPKSTNVESAHMQQFLP